MDTDGDHLISMDEWLKNMPKDMQAALEKQLNDDDILEGFKPLVDVAKVQKSFSRAHFHFTQQLSRDFNFAHPF